MHQWRFYQFVMSGCSKNDAGSVAAFAECDEKNEKNNNGHLTHLTNRTNIIGEKCPLTVAATKFEPFTYYDESKGYHKGIDYFLVKNIAKQLHIDVNFIQADANSIKCVFSNSIV